jgi:transposase-like protein
LNYLTAEKVRFTGRARKVDDLVKALGADTGISKSEVSRICADLDTEVEGVSRPTDR